MAIKPRKLNMNQVFVLVWIATLSSTNDFSIRYAFCVIIKRIAI